MGYLEDFQAQIHHRDFPKFMQLWEEYCTSDRVEAEEFIALLKSIKSSDFSKPFGRFVETALPLWKTFDNVHEAYEILKYLVDLQTTNTSLLADTALEMIKNKYGEHPQLNERLRLVGLRSRDDFQGALSNYDLLNHLGTGKFVFHSGGWGTGEIMEISPLCEQLTIEFENVAGRKHVTFVNAFKMLSPLPDNHFLARRFADPDTLEKEAKEDPIAIVKSLLRDLGPKSASEIKDELCELVIPEKDWAKWWQGARAKLKKDDMVESPEGVKGLFSLRKAAPSEQEHLDKAFQNKNHPDEVIQASYNLVRDLPKSGKKADLAQAVEARLSHLLKEQHLSAAQQLQILLLLNEYFSRSSEGKRLESFLQECRHIESAIDAIEIVALKKKALVLVRKTLPHWVELFCKFLHSTEQGVLRDYIVKELNEKSTHPTLVSLIEALVNQPAKDPDLFYWYFQQAVSSKKGEIPFADKKGLCRLFESYLILLSTIESKPDYKDLAKKMYTTLLDKRYAVVRHLLEGTDLSFVKEFLLLVSKCQMFSDHDLQILRSLAEVVHPSLNKNKGHKEPDHNILWTTEAGYLKTQERAKQVGTVEVIENAREIEAARALGDLRENSEYKFAQERRARLQTELKTLSEQLKQARLITPADISRTEVGIGNVVDVQDENERKTSYTILGPWEADPDAHILSFQSKLAQTMCGLKVGDTFTFRDEELRIAGLRSYLT